MKWCIVLGLGALGLSAIGCGDDDGGATGTTGGGGAGQGGAGGEGAGPIVADPDTWTWVPVEGAVCGTGTPSGLGINPSASGDKLVIYLQGGGVCYDQATCLGPDPGASNVDGFGDAEFAEFTGGEGVRGLFDRADANNPFADYNFIFVPYCTGDVHAGNNVFDDLQFVGHKNVELILARVLPTFPDVTQVVLTGSSAGGFGAMYNYYQVQTAFGETPVVLIDDSGPFLPLEATPQLAALATFFGLEGTIAPGCPDCLDITAEDGGLHQLIPLYAELFPGHRGSLISSLQDTTIATNFDMTGEELETALGVLAEETVPLNPDFRVFFLTGDHHVWLVGGEGGDDGLSDITSNGVTLADFLRQQIDGDAGWSNVLPPP